MAINKIIAIGGTGVKCLESFVNYCATSCVKVKYDVLIVEADEDNGNLNRLQKTVENYSKVQSILYHDNIEGEKNLKYGFGGIFTLDNNNWFKVWKPTDITGHDNTLANTRDFIGSDLAKALYTEDEIKVSLNEGFRGHPSIGALMTGMSIKMLDKEWDSFIGKNSNVSAEEQCKVFVVGSLFGGTGASGIYSIVNELVTFSINDGNVNFKYIDRIENDKLKISIGMMTPYYTLPQKGFEKELGIKEDDTLENTNYALKFYKDYPTLLNNLSIVLVGKDDRDIMRNREYDKRNKKWATKPIEHKFGGKEQENPSLVSELVMATSMWQFFNNKNPNLFEKGCSYIPSRKTKADNVIDWSTLRSSEKEFPANLRTTLSVFLCFRYKLYPKLNAAISTRITSDFATKYGWLEYFRVDLEDDTQKENINSQIKASCGYMSNFIKWAHSVGNVTIPINENSDGTNARMIGNIIDIDLLESIIESDDYMENFDYGSLVIDYNKKKMQWSKGIGSMEVKLNNKSKHHQEANGYSLYTLLAKLYTVGGAK